MADSGLKQIGQGVLVILLGVAIAGGGWYLYQDAQQATQNAVEVEGTVVSTGIDEKRVDDDDGGGSDIVYSPVVQYRYTYEGEQYSSSNLCPGMGSGCDAAQNRDQRSDVKEFLSDYPEGESVTIHVLPEEPSRAFLVNTGSASKSYLFIVGFGGLFGLFGLVALASGVKDLLD